MILARELSMTRAELRQRMSTVEFYDWLVFYGLEAEERERALWKAKHGIE